MWKLTLDSFPKIKHHFAPSRWSLSGSPYKCDSGAAPRLVSTELGPRPHCSMAAAGQSLVTTSYPAYHNQITLLTSPRLNAVLQLVLMVLMKLSHSEPGFFYSTGFYPFGNLAAYSPYPYYLPYNYVPVTENTVFIIFKEVFSWAYCKLNWMFVVALHFIPASKALPSPAITYSGTCRNNLGAEVPCALPTPGVAVEAAGEPEVSAQERWAAEHAPAAAFFTSLLCIWQGC